MTSYVVEYKSVDSLVWSQLAVEDIKSRKTTVEKLKEGLQYVFRVAGQNLAGVGEFSTESAAVLLAGNIQTYVRAYIHTGKN